MGKRVGSVWTRVRFNAVSAVFELKMNMQIKIEEPVQSPVSLAQCLV